MLSGVNRGANLGEDVLYSGTVAAAMEGAMLGIPAIAFSQVRVQGQGQAALGDGRGLRAPGHSQAGDAALAEGRVDERQFPAGAAEGRDRH